MVTILLTIALAFVPCQSANRISDAQKREFIELLRTFPVRGEFYTDEAVEQAGSYLPVLFALTQADIERYDIYPFAAISRGLCNRREHRRYAVRHFAEIQHPELKLFWGAMLFDAGTTSPEVVRFLRDALASEEQTRLLSEMIGPRFEDFRRRVMSHRINIRSQRRAKQIIRPEARLT
jgi:hypothetical protein